MSPKFMFNVRYDYYRTIHQTKNYFYSVTNVISIIDTMLYRYIQYKRSGKNSYPSQADMQDVPQIIDDFKTKYHIEPTNPIIMNVAYSQYHYRDNQLVFFFNNESVMSILFQVLSQYLRDQYSNRLTNHQVLNVEREVNQFMNDINNY